MKKSLNLLKKHNDIFLCLIRVNIELFSHPGCYIPDGKLNIYTLPDTYTRLVQTVQGVHICNVIRERYEKTFVIDPAKYHSG